MGLLGLASTFLIRFFPFLYVYKTPLQIGSIVLIVIGTYMSGAISNEEAWQARVKEMEAKVAAAQIESLKENVKIVEKVVKKTEYIKTRGQDITKYVDREIVKYDNTCVIPQEFIKAHNMAAEAPK